MVRQHRHGRLYCEEIQKDREGKAGFPGQEYIRYSHGNRCPEIESRDYEVKGVPGKVTGTGPAKAKKGPIRKTKRVSYNALRT